MQVRNENESSVSIMVGGKDHPPYSGISAKMGEEWVDLGNASTVTFERGEGDIVTIPPHEDVSITHEEGLTDAEYTSVVEGARVLSGKLFLRKVFPEKTTERGTLRSGQFSGSLVQQNGEEYGDSIQVLKSDAAETGEAQADETEADDESE
jgi:hypothetical protein